MIILKKKLESIDLEEILLFIQVMKKKMNL